jgi:GH43 family beta-xylosidase
MGGSFSTLSKHIKQWAVIDFLMHENETSIEIHEWLLVYYGEDTVDMSTVHCWIRKSRDSRNLDMNNQLQSGKPVIATHYLNRQKVDKCPQENQLISQTTIIEKLNFGLPGVNEIIHCRFGLQKCVRYGCYVTLCLKSRE